MPKLFKNDDLDSEEKLNINTDYATNYDNWRQKEELHKLKARYGEDAETLLKSDEESSESSEDDEGEEIPEEFEKNFYKTLACLKNKDPRIYNEEVKFFDKTDLKSVESAKKEKKEKSLFLRDYERKIIVERGGKYSDSEDEDNENAAKPRSSTYVQEQQELKESFKKALQDEVDAQGDDLLFKPKSKSKEEKLKEEEDYKEWLKGQKTDINKEQEKELKPLRDFWTDPNLDANEKFLRDYVLNKKFLDKESTDADLDYEHVAHDSDENLSEDERNINTQEEFEHKYNFRFEEPDQEFIKRYPRTLENSLRKKDTRRAQKRAEVKTRKEEEKLKKREELKELKAMKRKEIEEKIEKLKEITGNDDLKLDTMDLEGDFDPDEYDKKMSQIFNEDYYAGQEEEDAKPEFPDIDEELHVESTWDDYEPGAEEIAQEEIPYHDVPHCEDPEFNMDADYNGKSLQEELVESTKKRKKRRRSKFAELISKEKPKFDPTLHPSYQEYYDQYYALDYEDMIGDLPCRFKYRQVVPNDYGLTVEEILMADDRELNKWCSLKKALEHKPEYKELNEVKIYKQKAANEGLKKKILKSLYSAPEEETPDPIPGPSGILPNPGTESTKKTRKRKRKNKQNGEINAETDNYQSKEKEEKCVESGEPNNKKLKKSMGDIVSTSEKQESITKTDFTENNNEHGSKKKIKLDNSAKDKQIEVSEKKKKKNRKVPNGLEITKSDSENIESTKIKEKSKSKSKIKDTVKQLDTIENAESSGGDKINKKQINKNNKKPENGVLSKKQQRRLLFLEKNKNKKNNNKGDSKEIDQIASLSAERLKAYGLNPKKFKNKLKYMKKD